MAVALGRLALGTQTSVARNASGRRHPAEVRLIAPGPQCLRPWHGFRGASGVWDNTDGFCFTLVVEEVFANGYARITHSHGRICNPERPLPGFMRVTGKVVDGTLRFHRCARSPGGRYRFADETLQGTYKGGRRISLTSGARCASGGLQAASWRASSSAPCCRTTRPADRGSYWGLTVGPVHTPISPVGPSAPAPTLSRGP